jgi:hypothetical protein
MNNIKRKAEDVMKTLLKANVVMAALAVALTNPVMAADTGDPAYVGLKIYQVYASPHTDCSQPIRIFESQNPSYQDMLQSPQIGSGAIPDGTYPCIMIEMNDVLLARPAYNSTSGHCTTSTDIVLDVASGQFGTPYTEHPVTGERTSLINDSGTGQRVWLYMTTTGGVASGPWTRAEAMRLETPLVVNGDKVGIFVADFRGQVQDNFGTCGCEAPVFSFRN